MTAVPSLLADAGAVAALAVLLAARVARPDVAVGAGPAVAATARVVLAVAVGAAVDVADGWKERVWRLIPLGGFSDLVRKSA